MNKVYDSGFELSLLEHCTYSSMYWKICLFSTKSAASLYKAPCNVMLFLILVHMICDIYVEKILSSILFKV
jgi:hypothetical protein